MDVRKIVRKVLLEADEQTTEGGYVDYMGRPLPSTFGGESITNITPIGVLPSSFDKLNADVFQEYCEKSRKNPSSKFYNTSSEECLNLQKKMVYDIQNVGAPNGTRSFYWKGQKFRACLKRDKTKETLRFSGYYGNVDSKSNCFAPEWFYMIQQDKKKTEKGGNGTPGSSRGITMAGPDYKTN